MSFIDSLYMLKEKFPDDQDNVLFSDSTSLYHFLAPPLAHHLEQPPLWGQAARAGAVQPGEKALERP